MVRSCNSRANTLESHITVPAMRKPVRCYAEGGVLDIEYQSSTQRVPVFPACSPRPVASGSRKWKLSSCIRGAPPPPTAVQSKGQAKRGCCSQTTTSPPTGNPFWSQNTKVVRLHMDDNSHSVSPICIRSIGFCASLDGSISRELFYLGTNSLRCP